MSVPRRERVGWLVGCIALCGCRAGEPRANAEPSRPALQLTPGALLPSAAPARAARRSHELRYRVVGAQPSPGSELVAEGVGRRLPVGSNDALLLDLPDGTRLRVAPKSRLWTFTHAKSLLLVSGQVRITRLPDASRSAAAQPARIASLGGSFEVTAGADFWLRAEVKSGAGDGKVLYRVQLGLLRGAVVWLHDGDALRAQEHLLLGDEPLPAAPPGLQLLVLPDERRAQAQADKAWRSLRPVAAPADLERVLSAALSEERALRERGRALLASTKRARLSGESGGLRSADAARERERALVELARQRSQQQQALQLAAERSVLSALARCAGRAGDACPAPKAWALRFAEALAK